MPAYQKWVAWFLGLLMALTTSIALAEGVSERDAVLGVLGFDKEYGYWLVDLNFRDPKSDAPYLFNLVCDDCPLKVGRSYPARMGGAGPHRLISILGNDGAVHGDGNKPPFTWLQGANLLVCDPTPGGVHWEWSDGAAVCKVGAQDSHRWKSDTKTPMRDVANEKPLPHCAHPGFAKETLSVVITVKPIRDQTWKFPEAPSIVSARILSDLNANRNDIRFVEANGVAPDFAINVTLSETNEGTGRDSATAEFTQRRALEPFQANSGEAPFTSWTDAADHLATNMLVFFETGWHVEPPCWAANGLLQQ